MTGWVKCALKLHQAGLTPEQIARYCQNYTPSGRERRVRIGVSAAQVEHALNGGAPIPDGPNSQFASRNFEIFTQVRPDTRSLGFAAIGRKYCLSRTRVAQIFATEFRRHLYVALKAARAPVVWTPEDNHTELEALRHGEI